MQIQERSRTKELTDIAIPIAKKMAGYYTKMNPGGNFDDYYDLALIGILQAIARYDPNKGGFKTFCYKHVKRAVFTEWRDKSPVPYRIQNLYFKGKALDKRKSLSNNLAIATSLGLTEEQWVNCCLAMKHYYYGLERLEVPFDDRLGFKAQSFYTSTVPSLYSLLKCFGFNQNLDPRSPKWNWVNPAFKDKAQIKDLRNQGLSARQISSRTGYGVATIEAVLRSQGMSGHQQYNQSRREVTKHLVAEISKVLDKRKISIRRFAQEAGFARDVYFRWRSGKKGASLKSQEKIETWLQKYR